MHRSKTFLVVAAFDIGTTYSGCAYSLTYDKTKVHVNQFWNEMDNLISRKTPTSVLIDDKGQFHSFGFEAEKTFAKLEEHRNPSEWRMFRRFKMIQHTDKVLSRHTTVEDTDGNSYPAMKIFALAIRYFHRLLLDTLHVKFVAILESDIKYIITVPAIWDGWAKRLIRDAALEAGIECNRLQLACDSEAVVRGCSERNEPLLGSKLIVVDLGGENGMFSLIQKFPNGRLKVIQTASATGCGGTCVDRKFKEYLENVLGYRDMNKFFISHMDDYIELMGNFEIKKRTVKWNANNDVLIRLPVSLLKQIHPGKSAPLLPGNAFTDGKLRIDIAIYKTWFEAPVLNVIKQIKDLRTQFHEEDLNSVLLVGGFANSEYVQKMLKKELKKTGIKLIVPEEPDFAVLRGAVLCGYEPEQDAEEKATEIKAVTNLDDMDHSDTLKPYAMTRNPRGLCIIINNQEFCDKKLTTRYGSDKDKDNLQRTFTYLGFIVECHDNLTDVEMIKKLVDVSHNIDHTNYDCFVCCILTHGELNHLYGINGRCIPLKDLTINFQTKRCPSLAGKPKLFFLQACQGDDRMGAGEVPQADSSRLLHNEVATVTSNTLPNESDFLLGYATVPGYVSWRNHTTGSWFIGTLCEQLRKHAHREDILSILTIVNNEVSNSGANSDDGRYRQVPAPQFTLRKKLYLKPI